MFNTDKMFSRGQISEYCRCFLMGQAAVNVNGRIWRIGGNIDQTGFDQAMRQRIDNKPQHTGHDQGA